MTDHTPAHTTHQLDYASPTIDKGRWRVRVRLFFAEPPSLAYMVLLFLLGCGLLWWVRLPPIEVYERVIRIALSLMIGGLAIARAWLQFICIVEDSPCTIRRAILLIVLGLLVPTAVVGSWPLKVSFDLSLPAMNRLAAHAAAHPQASIPDQRVGLYHARDIRCNSSGIHFRVSSRSGFGMSEGDDDHQVLRQHSVTLYATRSGWYIWNYDW